MVKVYEVNRKENVKNNTQFTVLLIQKNKQNHGKL